MYPKIYNSDGELLAVLSNIIRDTASVRRVINGEFTFTFEAYEEELKSEYFATDNLVVVDGQSFDIKYYEQRHNNDVRYQIQCEHVNYRLEDGEENLHEMYTNTGTPAFILADILSGTEFSVGVVDFTEAITITSGESEVTKKTLIYELVNILGGEVEYTDNGFTINILNTIGQDNGFQVRFGKNLLGITKFVDNRGEFQVSYEVDIVELKNSNEYIEKQLQGLEVIGVGDSVRIVDDVIGLDIVNRIVSKEYNPILSINTKLEITNKIDTIIDTLISVQTTTVKMDKLYNNVSISNEYGFKAERSDKKAKIEMNATEGLSVFTRSDPESSYSKNLMIDSDGNIVMTGKLNLIADSDVSVLGLKALAYEDNVDWDTQLIHIPNTLKAPAGTGLFLSPTHMGFHHATHGWRTYMDGDGNFYLGGVAGKLQWNPTFNTLHIEGNIVMTGGSITWASVTGTIPDTKIDSASTWNGKTTQITADGVYTGTIKANQLVIGGTNGSISFNDLSDQPYIPPSYTDAQALAAWVASGYKTYIDANGLYTGTVTANKILIGGTNGSISFNDLSDKPTIPVLPGYIQSTKITSTLIEAPTISGGTINVSTDITVGNNMNMNSGVEGENKSILFTALNGTRPASILWRPNETYTLQIDSRNGISVSGYKAQMYGRDNLYLSASKEAGHVGLITMTCKTLDFTNCTTITGLQVKFA